ncbi:MAG: bifunctional adenosylcobinamide kinase/adenosylcobinamide-phosphate guanylyltransferase [Acidimicrobiales bacterium]
MLTLLVGGARSGKSALAERMAEATGAPVAYLATALVDPADRDFAWRVAAHRFRRPSGWTTIDAGAGLVVALGSVPDTHTVLVDSLGTWVAAHHDFDLDVAPLVATLAARSGATVVVSEEVGLGVHPETHLGRRFRDVLGSVNQAVAAVADQALLVVAGRVLALDRWDG